jgi:hypothetical protein
LNSAFFVISFLSWDNCGRVRHTYPARHNPSVPQRPTG